MIIKAACVSSIGNIREKNEDNIYFNGRFMPENNKGIKQPMVTLVDNDESLFCIFDGMGGYRAGEVASFIAANETKEYMAVNEGCIVSAEQMLTELSCSINDRIFKLSKTTPDYWTMGTTGVILRFLANEVYVCNVGDSPAFRFRDNELIQLSEDHIQCLSTANISQTIITQYFGMDPSEIMIKPYIAKAELKRGDRYLMCSDGLTKMVSQTEIGSILRSSVSPKKAVEKLMQKALKNGGNDNITIILCNVR